MTNLSKNETAALLRSHNIAPLESILCTEELSRRPRRPPDYATENRALVMLAQALADSPQTILQKVAEKLLEVLRCGSAGFSLLTNDDQSFYWPAIAGAWQPHVGSGTPRDFSPCGEVLDRKTPQLFRHWERRYRYLLSATPPAEESLLVPFYVEAKAVGMIWAIAHDHRRKFDAEDVRLLETLGQFASAAYQATRSFDADAQRRAALNLMEDALEAREETEKLNGELRASEERLAAELASTQALQAVSTRMFQQDDVDALYGQVLDAAVVIMRSDMAGLQIVDAGENALQMLAFRGVDPELGTVFGLDQADAQTCYSIARRVGHRVVVPDVETCDFIIGTPALEDHRKSGIRAVQSTPLISRSGLVLGVISTHWRQPHEPSERALRLLDVLARQAADLIERSRLERETREQAAALADLHCRKDEFLAMLSHELRSPLAPIANAVDLLRRERGSESETAQKARAIIERQVGHLKHLVDDLLEVSRITTGRVQLRQERVALASIVEGAVETARPLIEQLGHALSVSLPPEPIWLEADAARLEQVLVNLLTNAAKFTQEGGRIQLTAELESDAAVLRVRDSGIGIAPELLPSIFEMFTQAEPALDRSQGGLGIGLALVQRLVELHGGTVEVSSVLGQGSEFVLRLPAPCLPAPSPAVATAQAIAKPSRVLVVDDNVDSAESLAMLLQASRHDVRTAHDGPTALTAALDYRPDVMLLDIGMPGMNGYEIAGIIRRNPLLRDIVLIAVTGYGHETDRQRAQAAGFDHHVVKPADFATVQKIIASASLRRDGM
jgi:signal transduction histidine kinase/ActR/RegA family two-component response regulator